MKIAILHPYIAGIGGGQRLISKVAHYLHLNGHKVEFFTQKYDRKSCYKEFNKFRINMLKPASKLFSPFVFLFKKIKGFDLIILSDFPATLASIRNKPAVNICYTPKRDFYDLRKYYFKENSFFGKLVLSFKILAFKKLDFLAAQKATLILSISKNVQKRVEKYYKRKDSKIAYPGIDFEKYKQGSYSDYVLCVSRFITSKRVDVVIKSMGFVKNKKIKLYVAGEGPEKENLIELAEKYPNVKFFGRVDEKSLRELYSNCLAVVYVPIGEDFGLVPVEAGASGKPTIGVNDGGLKETITNNKNGFLLSRVSPKRIAEKIDYLAENKEIARKMGKQARKNSRKFDWKTLLPKWEKLIIDCLDKTKN